MGAALVGFAALSAVDVSPAWAALGAAILVGAPRLARGQERPRTILREPHLGFCLFVLALSVIVAGTARHGLADATYVGSLATLLWRRRLPAALRPTGREFHTLGLVATPIVLVATVIAMWRSWLVVGR